MMNRPTHKYAVMLPGGGARGAYQVGALRAVWEIAQQHQNLFPIITGTSAGAINAAVLASHAHEFEVGIERLEHFWRTMFCGRIYRTGTADAMSSAWNWLRAILFNRSRQQQPKSLLDNQPLAELLKREFRVEGVQQAIQRGALEALAITASGYTSASAVSFYQGQADIVSWERSRRLGVPTHISPQHLLASSALPFLFPAQLIGHEYFGDGGIRQTAPLSPAVHLGASHILVIGTRDEHLDTSPEQRDSEYPSLGDIAGYMLDVIFMDNLQADLARLQRINRTLSLMTAEAKAKTHLRPIHTLVLKPSQDIREIAQKHTHHMPSSVRYLLRAVGAWGHRSRLPSYLLFEADYCSELIELGYTDTISQRQQVEAFFTQHNESVSPAA